jgi:excisionase family DNA binding protein
MQGGFRAKKRDQSEIPMGQQQQTSTSRRQANPAEFPEILTAKELEALLRIDVKTIYGYVQRGLIPYVRIQSNLRFRKQEVLDWLASQSYSPHSAAHESER